ncbi:MAG: hypothetical protein QXL94_02235 [Candidatus Parvarchaeum sp.]
MTIDVIFSGIEGSMRELNTMFEAGYKVNNLMCAYSSFRNNEKFLNELEALKKKFGFKLYVDSGAHAFIFSKNVAKKEKGKGWHEEAKVAAEFKGKEEEYFNEYFEWLKTHKDFYDYAVEFDIQSVIGNEKVDEWRDELFQSGLPIIYVVHTQAGDTLELVKKWKERGATYIGMGETVLDETKARLIGRGAIQLGLKVHVFGFTPKNLYTYRDMMTSVDSSSWLAGSKLAKAVVLKGKALQEVDLKEDKLRKMSLLKENFFDCFGRETVEKKTAGNQYWYFNFWNLWQMQKWSDINNGVRGYTKQLEAIEEGKLPMPSWANNFDKNGLPKKKYLASRFNNWKSGVYAKSIQNMSLYCDMCPVGGASATGSPLCVKYEAGGLCYFLPHWKKLGMNTRNKEQVVRTLEELVADAMVRYQYARYQEQLTGVIDKNVSAMYRELVTSMELYNRVAFGIQNVSTLNMLNVGDNKVQVNVGFDASLEKVRELYGDNLAKRIEKKIKNVESEQEKENDSE